jgi:hypothetical protein
VYAQQGYAAALVTAWELPPLSVTQNMFVGLMSPLLEPSPASIQLYNVVAVAVALAAIGFMTRRFGLTVWSAAPVLGSFFLPDILYYWDLGLFDFRRETGLYSFLVAALAFGAAITLAPNPRTRIRDGVIFGVLCGLFLLSRDNAALVGIGLLFIPITTLWVVQVVRKNTSTVLFQIAGTAAGFAPFFAVFLVRLGDILGRLLDPSVMYANNGDRWASFVGNILSPLKVILGGDSYVFNRFPRATIFLFAIIALLALIAAGVMLAMRSRGPIASSRPLTPRSKAQEIGWLPFLALFVWPPVYMHLMLSFVTGWLPGQSLIVGLAPYVPACAGIVFPAVWVAGAIENAPFRLGKFAAIASALLIAASVPVRAEMRKIRYPAEAFTAHNYLASLTTPSGRAPVFAELAKSDLRVPAITLMAAIGKRPEPRSLRFRVDGDKMYDVHIATPPADQIDKFLRALEMATLCDADYVLMNDTAQAFLEPGSPQLVPGHGAPLYEALQGKLASSPRKIVSSNGKERVVVIDNVGRLACPLR